MTFIKALAPNVISRATSGEGLSGNKIGHLPLGQLSSGWLIVLCLGEAIPEGTLCRAHGPKLKIHETR